MQARKQHQKSFKKTRKPGGSEPEKVGFRLRAVAIFNLGSIFIKLSKMAPKWVPK